MSKVSPPPAYRELSSWWEGMMSSMTCWWLFCFTIFFLWLPPVRMDPRLLLVLDTTMPPFLVISCCCCWLSINNGGVTPLTLLMRVLLLPPLNANLLLPSPVIIMGETADRCCCFWLGETSGLPNVWNLLLVDVEGLMLNLKVGFWVRFRLCYCYCCY